jgi:hypothetical protein
LEPDNREEYTFTLDEPLGGVATAVQGSGADDVRVSVVYATRSQLREIGDASCEFSGEKTLNLNVVKGASDIVDAGKCERERQHGAWQVITLPDLQSRR